MAPTLRLTVGGRNVQALADPRRGVMAFVDTLLAARGVAMGGQDTHTGGCFCGEVQFEVSGQPAAMNRCHCESCRHWSAGPVNAFTSWASDALKPTRGAASIGTCNKTPISFRKWC